LPAYSKIIQRYIPIQYRGVANASIAAGVFLGPTFVALAGGPLVTRHGWRLCFMVFGLASLVWLAPWLRMMPQGQGTVAAHSGPVPSTAQILRQKSAWGTFVGLFCGQYYFYFLITWLPYYLVRHRRFSTDAMATTAGGAFLGMAVCTLLAGRLSDLWIKRGRSPTLVCKTLVGGGLMLASVIALAPVVSSQTLSIAFLVLSCMSLGVCYSNTWTVTQTLAGPHAVARWSGVKNFVGNLSGVIAPVITGFLVERKGNFSQAFLVVGAIALVGGVSWTFLVGRVQPIKWQDRNAG